MSNGLSELIKPIGIFAYVYILLAVLTGLKIIKAPLKVHRLLALIGIISATIHALIVLYLTYF
ncbi:MAG: hypothetical protein N3A65_03395 [candidate division WOR-3 bacterium]|nr:hypothetical protein [candidate division WOR-3 bacterium]